MSLAPPDPCVPLVLDLRRCGGHHDLEGSRDRVLADYFPAGAFTPPVRWGRRATRRAMATWRPTTLGVRGEGVIQVNPLLDQPAVPLVYIDFLLYHELLHAYVPPVVRGGRVIHHHRLFRVREREFAHLVEALAWERDVLTRAFAARDARPRPAAPGRRWRGLAFVLAACLALGAAAAQDTVTADDLAASVVALGDPEFRVRANAMDRLIGAGHAAFDLVAARADDPDLEVRARARFILARTRYDVPLEVRRRFPDLIADLAHPDPRVLADALEGLARFESPASRALALEILGDPWAIERLEPERVRDLATIMPGSTRALATHLRGDAALAANVLPALDAVLAPEDADSIAALIDLAATPRGLGASDVPRLRARMRPGAADAEAWRAALAPHAAALARLAAARGAPGRALGLEFLAVIDPEQACVQARDLASEPSADPAVRGACARVLAAAGHLDDALALSVALDPVLSRPDGVPEHTLALTHALGDAAGLDPDVATIAAAPATALGRLRALRSFPMVLDGALPLGIHLLALAERSGCIPVYCPQEARFALRTVTRPGDVLILPGPWYQPTPRAQAAAAAAQAEITAAGDRAQAISVAADAARAGGIGLVVVDPDSTIAKARTAPTTTLAVADALELVTAARAAPRAALTEALVAAHAGDGAALVRLACTVTTPPLDRRRAFLTLAAQPTLAGADGARLSEAATDVLVQHYANRKEQTVLVSEAAGAWLATGAERAAVRDAIVRILAVGESPWQEPILSSLIARHPDGELLDRLALQARRSTPSTALREALAALAVAVTMGEPRVARVADRPEPLAAISVTLPPRDYMQAELADALAQATGLEVVVDPDPAALLDDPAYDLRARIYRQPLDQVLTRIVTQTRASGRVGANEEPLPELAFMAGGRSILLTTRARADALGLLAAGARLHPTAPETAEALIGAALAVPRGLTTGVTSFTAHSVTDESIVATAILRLDDEDPWWQAASRAFLDAASVPQTVRGLERLRGALAKRALEALLGDETQHAAQRARLDRAFPRGR